MYRLYGSSTPCCLILIAVGAAFSCTGLERNPVTKIEPTPFEPPPPSSQLGRDPAELPPNEIFPDGGEVVGTFVYNKLSQNIYRNKGSNANAQPSYYEPGWYSTINLERSKRYSRVCVRVRPFPLEMEPRVPEGAHTLPMLSAVFQLTERGPDGDLWVSPPKILKEADLSRQDLEICFSSGEGMPEIGTLKHYLAAVNNGELELLVRFEVPTVEARQRSCVIRMRLDMDYFLVATDGSATATTLKFGDPVYFTADSIRDAHRNGHLTTFKSCRSAKDDDETPAVGGTSLDSILSLLAASRGSPIDPTGPVLEYRGPEDQVLTESKRESEDEDEDERRRRAKAKVEARGPEGLGGSTEGDIETSEKTRRVRKRKRTDTGRISAPPGGRVLGFRWMNDGAEVSLREEEILVLDESSAIRRDRVALAQTPPDLGMIGEACREKQPACNSGLVCDDKNCRLPTKGEECRDGQGCAGGFSCRAEMKSPRKSFKWTTASEGSIGGGWGDLRERSVDTCESGYTIRVGKPSVSKSSNSDCKAEWGPGGGCNIRVAASRKPGEMGNWHCDVYISMEKPREATGRTTCQ